MHPIALMIMFDMIQYLVSSGVNPVITSTVSTIQEDKELGRVSLTHRTGRAFDLSIKEWPDNFTNYFVRRFKNKYGHYGAIVNGSPSLIVDHIGTARHLHIQINAKYKR